MHFLHAAALLMGVCTVGLVIGSKSARQEAIQEPAIAKSLQNRHGRVVCVAATRHGRLSLCGRLAALHNGDRLVVEVGMVKDRHKTARLEDIARQAGVSVSTVSRALNGGAAVNSETRQRIMELARSEHYSGPTRRPRLVRNGNTNAITVVLSPIQPQATSLIDPFLLSILGGITIALQQHGLDLSISHDVPRDERSLARFAQDNVRDGIIFLGQSPYHDGLNRLMQTGRKFVVWGAREVDQAYCTVGSDNWKGGERATSHLLRLGRKRVAFLGYVGTTELQQRQQGYLAALDKQGLLRIPVCNASAASRPTGQWKWLTACLTRGLPLMRWSVSAILLHWEPCAP
jgi:DNA-binding LacI/PurR family transcriptional regulator